MVAFIAFTISFFLGCTQAVPAAKADTSDDIPTGDKIGALIIVVIAGAVGGMIIQLIQGLEFYCIKVKPLCTCITCPPLVGMIIAGCIARNFFGEYTKANYPDYWADWIR